MLPVRSRHPSLRPLVVEGVNAAKTGWATPAVIPEQAMRISFTWAGSRTSSRFSIRPTGP